MKSSIAKKNIKIKKEVYKMLLSLKLIAGNEDWHQTQWLDDKTITLYSNKKIKGYTTEIKVYIKYWELKDTVIRNKYDVMRWKTGQHTGEIVYNLKELLFKQEMHDIINCED